VYTKAKTLDKENVAPVNSRKYKKESASDIEELSHVLVIPRLHTNEKNRLHVKDIKFSIRIQSAKPLIVLNELLKEINSFAGLILEEWNKYLKVLTKDSIEIMKSLATDYEQQLNKTLEYFVFSNEVNAAVDELRDKILLHFRSLVPVMLE
jgi:hypothetical protein